MQYHSTRGQAPRAGFATVLLNGLAPDGGLYVPETVVPFDTAASAAVRDLSLIDLTTRIVARFAAPDLDEAQIAALLARAHDGFTHPAVTPLVQLGPEAWLMELFHGPTLAFKDLAMQALAPLMGHLLAQARRGATIIGATSGDTGGAALAAFAGVPGVRALFLYPEGGVSPFQAAQMAALSRPDLRAQPVIGTFDDCQRIVKTLLAEGQAQGHSDLTAVNSVNWGRILAQAAYYARAALLLGGPGRPVHFVVPTGNFGNVYAGLLARRLGFAVGQMVVATNANDTLHRLVQTGHAPDAPVQPTLTPAMDIRVPSNLERLVHDLGGPAPGAPLQQALHATIRSAAVTDDATLAQIRLTHAQTGLVVDPHTAVALAAARVTLLPPGPVVVLATAHPAKFAPTVARALGHWPAHLDRPLPATLGGAAPPIPADPGTVRGLLRAP